MYKSFKLTLFVLLLSSMRVLAQNNVAENSNSVENINFAYLENTKSNTSTSIFEENKLNASENSAVEINLLKETASAAKALRSSRKKRSIFHYILIGATTFGAAIAITTLGASAGR